MAKLVGADCRNCRREGCKLFLKGERCVSKKCAFERRPVIPGQHGADHVPGHLRPFDHRLYGRVRAGQVRLPGRKGVLWRRHHGAHVLRLRDRHSQLRHYE